MIVKEKMHNAQQGTLLRFPSDRNHGLQFSGQVVSFNKNVQVLVTLHEPRMVDLTGPTVVKLSER